MLKINIRHKMLTSGGPKELIVDTVVENNEILCLFGHSGSGKTTLLRIISGLTKPDAGKIEFNNVVWFDSAKKINIPPQKRNAGFMFQDYALFPHLSVEKNIGFAQSKKNIVEVNRLIQLFDLMSFRKQKPAKLSGGQRQRVALARTLAASPVILLLDEPLSALDFQMRNDLQNAILTAHEELNTISIMVSHDLEEVRKMADRVLLIKNGEVVDIGHPEQVFKNLK